MMPLVSVGAAVNRTLGLLPMAPRVPTPVALIKFPKLIVAPEPAVRFKESKVRREELIPTLPCWTLMVEPACTTLRAPKVSEVAIWGRPM